MDNAEVLNRVLSVACHDEPDEQGWATFEIELHCVQVTIVARRYGANVLTEQGDFDYCRFEVKKVTYT